MKKLRRRFETHFLVYTLVTKRISSKLYKVRPWTIYDFKENLIAHHLYFSTFKNI